MRNFWLFLFLVGCTTGELPTAVQVEATSTPRTDTTNTPYIPSRIHPSWVRDTTWIEDNIGMTLHYESEIVAGKLNPWSFSLVTDTLEAVRKGWKAQKFEVRPGDCYGNDCQRSPVYERNEFAQLPNENLEGDEYWYAWSFYVPRNISQAHWVFFGQFQQHHNYDSIWMFMKRSGQPFCAVFDWRNHNTWNCNGSRGTYPLIEDVNFAGKWHDVLVHAKWSQSNQGFTKIYIDGNLIVDYTGYTRTSGNKDVYFKYGIYRHGSNETTIVYYDEIRRGKTREDVDIRLHEK